MRIVVDNKLRLSGVPMELAAQIRKDLTLPNPEYVNRERQKLFIPPTMAKTVTVVEYLSFTGEYILPRGYIGKLKAMVGQCEVIDNRLNLPSVPMTFKGELRGYQRRVCSEMARYGSGILVAPPGAGKTAIACWLIAQKSQPSLLLCGTVDLAQQLAESVRKWLGIEPGFIGDGQWMVGREVTVALVQSLVARPEATTELTRQIGLVLLDECHHCPASTFMDIMQLFPAAYRYGVTATPTRKDGLGPFTEAVIGPIRAKVTHQDLERAGVLIRPRLQWVETNFRYSYMGDYAKMLTTLVKDEARNRLILDVIGQELREGFRCLVLTERVNHAELLAQELEKVAPGKVFCMTGQVSSTKREEALEGLRKGSLLCLVATKLADEGLDVPQLERLFLVTPARAEAKVMQRLGRLMRMAPGKAAPVVYDFLDPVGLLESQAKGRWYSCYRYLVQGELPLHLRQRAV